MGGCNFSISCCFSFNPSGAGAARSVATILFASLSFSSASPAEFGSFGTDGDGTY